MRNRTTVPAGRAPSTVPHGCRPLGAGAIFGAAVGMVMLTACSSGSSSPGTATGSGGTSGGTGGASTSPGASGGAGTPSGSGGATTSGSGGTTLPAASGGAPQSGSGGAAPTASGGVTGTGSGTGGGPGSSGTGGRDTTPGTGGSATPPPPGSNTLAFVGPIVVSGVRAVTTPPVTQVVKLSNGGASPAIVSAIALGGADAAAFKLSGMPTFPATLAPGASLTFTIEAMTTGSALPAAPAQDSGATLLTATLTATAGATTATANAYGMILTSATHECTLGQILTSLGYNKMNVGMAQNNANPNKAAGSMASTLPKVEAGTDEIAAPLFVKDGTASPTLVSVARYSPEGTMPYGWYPKGTPTMHNMIATMAAMPSAQTSNGARMVLPPLTGSTTFDPGTATFGIWVFSDQVTDKMDPMPSPKPENGDYDYSEDAPNSPANAHRTKVYPLKDATGTVVPGSYLLAVEEAGNGDYQDYVFVLSNVKPAP